eukprot:TRINITY_DN5897_c0_g1_i1.p1 TRINITY_DN5897_c0_g1~~TRINITY_DN5897_c0_g1_i1.p1  ORF type:complete len:138 (-),score=21.58 TRINITY_DN5897_c0_g1_i1:144-557(-)
MKPLMRMAAQGVQELHKNDIAHRDLSPENMVCHKAKKRKLELKIIDFGAALKLQEGSQKLCDCVGKKGYMSPEMDAGEYDPQANDIYGLGICFYHMLGGSKMSNYISKSARDLVTQMLKSEKERPTIDVVLKHTYWQ